MSIPQDLYWSTGELSVILNTFKRKFLHPYVITKLKPEEVILIAQGGISCANTATIKMHIFFINRNGKIVRDLVFSQDDNIIKHYANITSITDVKDSIINFITLDDSIPFHSPNEISKLVDLLYQKWDVPFITYTIQRTQWSFYTENNSLFVTRLTPNHLMIIYNEQNRVVEKQCTDKQFTDELLKIIQGD